MKRINVTITDQNAKRLHDLKETKFWTINTSVVCNRAIQESLDDLDILRQSLDNKTDE